MIPYKLMQNCKVKKSPKVVKMGVFVNGGGVERTVMHLQVLEATERKTISTHILIILAY